MCLSSRNYLGPLRLVPELIVGCYIRLLYDPVKAYLQTDCFHSYAKRLLKENYLKLDREASLVADPSHDNSTTAQWKCLHYTNELGFFFYIFTTFPFSSVFLIQDTTSKCPTKSFQNISSTFHSFQALCSR